MAGLWREKRRDQIQAFGYVAHSLEASLWAVGPTGSFAETVLLAANLGEDADTTAAITGQLAGALSYARRWRPLSPSYRTWRYQIRRHIGTLRLTVLFSIAAILISSHRMVRLLTHNIREGTSPGMPVSSMGTP